MDTAQIRATQAALSGGLLFPKTRRLKKPRKPLTRRSWPRSSRKPLRKTPLRRSSPLKKRLTPDPAGFREADVRAVFGAFPRCPLTGKRTRLDRHHILGRGMLFGIRPRDPRRRLFGSVYNCAVLDRDVHAGGYRDHPYMRALLLEIAAEKVREAVLRGYVVSQRDRDFLAIARGWLEGRGL
jgi:hypothetical protein